MMAWLLSIVGIVAIGVLLDILLPNGEINKYIKGIFGLIVVFVIILPLPKLLKGDYSEFFNIDEKIEIDEGYSSGIDERRNENREKELAAYLNSSGFYIDYAEIDYAEKYSDVVSVKIHVGRETDANSVRKAAANYLGIETNIISVIN